MGVGDDRQDKPTSVMGPDHLASLTAAKAEPPATAKGSERIARDRIRPAAPTVQVDPEEISGLIELAEVMVSQKPPPDVVALDADDKKTRKMDAEQFRALMKADKHADATAPLPTSVANAVIEQSRPAIGRAKTVDDPVTTSELSAKMNESGVKKLAASAAQPAPRTVTTTAELMAQVDEAFADFGADPEPVETAKQDASDDLAIPVQPLVETESKPAPAPAPAPDDLAIPTQALVGTESKPVKRPAMIVPDHRLDTRFAAAIAPITKPPLNVTKTLAETIADAKPRALAPEIVAEPRSISMLVLVSVLAVVIVIGTLVVLLT